VDLPVGRDGGGSTSCWRIRQLEGVVEDLPVDGVVENPPVGGMVENPPDGGIGGGSASWLRICQLVKDPPGGGIIK